MQSTASRLAGWPVYRRISPKSWVILGWTASAAFARHTAPTFGKMLLAVRKPLGYISACPNRRQVGDITFPGGCKASAIVSLYSMPRSDMESEATREICSTGASRFMPSERTRSCRRCWQTCSVVRGSRRWKPSANPKRNCCRNSPRAFRSSASDPVEVNEWNWP
jgi:hypothetical protein